MRMIVIGVDVHKHSLTATAVDELGRALAERSGPIDGEVVAWARTFGEERLWAVEDCRHVTRRLEQTLLGEGERLVRVPPGSPRRSVDAAVAAASPTRSTRSPSHELRCRSRCSTVLGQARRRCGS